MSESADPSSPASSAGRNLPPVEEPNPRFIVQLFVIPATIVGVLGLGVLALSYLVNRGADPTKYVQALRGRTEARWQAAASLADLLNNPRNKELKRDRRLAEELGTTLTDELAAPEPKVDAAPAEAEGESPVDRARQQRTMLEVFLCRALGEFEIVEALPPLLAAASHDQPQDLAVRRAAIEALAVLASHLPERTDDDLTAMRHVLVTAAADREPQIRSAAAYALGVLGDESSMEQLRRMLRDVYPDVRYNAASGLVRHSDPAALPVLLEMLNPAEVEESLELIARNEPSKERKKAQEQSREFSKMLILSNGIEGAVAVSEAHPEMEGAELRKALTRLTQDDQAAEIRNKAAAALRKLDERGAAPTTHGG